MNTDERFMMASHLSNSAILGSILIPANQRDGFDSRLRPTNFPCVIISKLFYLLKVFLSDLILYPNDLITIQNRILENCTNTQLE